MAAFHFQVHRDAPGADDRSSGDFPDCGMAFRAARAIIQRIRAQEGLSGDVLDRMCLEVTYDDGSELFRLPFSLGI